MLPLTFEHCQLTPTSDKLTSEGFDCINNLLSIFCKHRFIVNRLCCNQVGFHLTLLSDPTSYQKTAQKPSMPRVGSFRDSRVTANCVYSITSSARTSSEGGMSRPRAFAVF